MDALKLAFDLVIVGALALPWLAIAFDLFSGLRLTGIWNLIKREKDSVHPGVAGVLLFAMAYFLGAAISRVSEDFFNDDDLEVRITEGHILKDVFCSPDEVSLRKNVASMLTDNVHDALAKLAIVESCEPAFDRRPFDLEESSLLLQGGDKVERLNQLHSQSAVMRGAAFDGAIVCMLCLLGLLGTQKPRARLFFGIIPAAFIAGGWLTLWRHFSSHGADDPPFMECTFIVLGLVGGYALWQGVAAERRMYLSGLLISLLFTWLAYFGWWWTEVLYDRRVIHSFYMTLFTVTK